MRRSITRQGSSWSKHNISSDLWSEILTYLPVKTLVQFRSVCKSWKSLIDDPDFSSLHYKRCANNNLRPLLLLREVCHTGWQQGRWLLRRADCFKKISEIEFSADGTVPSSLRWGIVDAANGILLMADMDSDDHYILLNPSIRKILHIHLPYTPSLSYINYDICLGFDPSRNICKVVMIVHPPHSHEDLPVPSVEVFSLKTCLWRTLGSDCGVRSVFSQSDKLSFNGHVYWVGADYSDVRKITFVLVSFDLANDRFSYDPLPMGEAAYMMTIPIVVNGSSVGLLTPTSIWVMDESPCLNNTGVTWSKMYEIGHMFPQYYTFFHFTKDNTLVHDGVCSGGVTSRGVSAYDPKNDKKTVLSRSSKIDVNYLGAYIETLVLLNEGVSEGV